MARHNNKEHRYVLVGVSDEEGNVGEATINTTGNLGPGSKIVIIRKEVEHTKNGDVAVSTEQLYVVTRKQGNHYSGSETIRERVVKPFYR